MPRPTPARAEALPLALLALLATTRCDAATPGCSNNHEACDLWAKAGECDANPAFMHGECAASCDTCGKRRSSCDEITEDVVTEGDITSIMQSILATPHLGARALSTDPWVLHLETFLTAEEAEEVIRVGGHDFQRSLAGHDNGHTQVRTSSTSWCNVAQCERHAVMQALKKKITDAIRCPLKNTEHLQVLRYEPGQFYRVHNDQNSPFTSAAGPRVFTFFTYLSNVTQGGQTRFPKLNLTVEPRAGSAILWPSVRDDDVYATEHRTDHEAVDVVQGVKYAANFWTHLRDFQTPHANGCGVKDVPSALARREAARERVRARRAEQAAASGGVPGGASGRPPDPTAKDDL